MSDVLDLSSLDNVKPRADGSIKAACPACRAAGSDKSGDHLLIQADGKFGCAVRPDDHEHRKEIFKLAGKRHSLPATNGAPAKIVATYPYPDANGKLSYESVRYFPKTFKQRRPDPAKPGEQLWNMDGVKRVLYRLPEILKAKAGGKPVVIVEGEKDADCLAGHKFTATCNVGGAGKWEPDYSDTLAGCDCIVIADKDAPGRKHAQEVAASLSGKAKSVRLLELPDFNGKPVKDASDFFEAGATAQHFIAQIDGAPEWTPDEEKPGPWFELVQDGADIAAEVLPPVVQIVEDILPEECKLVIAGAAKTFKTWVALYCGLSIAHGLSFLNKPTTRRRVLYCNLELRAKAFNRRVQIIGRALGVDIERDWFVHLPLRGKLAGLFPGEIISRIIAIAKRLRAGVVVLDPTYKLLANAEENSSGAMTALFNEIDRLTTDAQCTVILCDHFSKGNKSETDPLDAIRGSSAKAGDVDAAMIIRPQETENCFSVDLIHRELPPVDPFVLEWDFPLMKVREDLDASRMRKSGGRGRVHTEETLLEALGNKSLTTTEWQELAEDEHGIPRRTFYELKKVLVNTGQVIQSAINNKWQKVNKTK